MPTIYDSNKAFHKKHLDILVCLLLVMATLCVYGQVKNHNFVNYDDDYYVYENRHVQDGLTSKSLYWAFTSTDAANWHPLTWLSHMLDYQFYGLDAGWHHLTNLLLHLSNTLLIFIFFRTTTKDFWQSAFVAALFAIHPLHVESVAWIAERKDVLSAFFGLLTLLSYTRWVKQPGVRTYLTTLLFFGLGLLAKPMLVTLPFVLLLLDYWPLKRLQETLSNSPENRKNRSVVLGLIWEKTPFFVLSVLSSAVTLWAQQRGGTVVSLASLPFTERVFNALVAYSSYIVKMIWPAKLAVFYPHAGQPPVWKILGSVVLFLSISWLAVKQRKQRPYLSVGWLWYLGTLVPVIGIVQVGWQSMADRYTYIPLIGLFIMLAWGWPDFWGKQRQKKIWLAGSAVFLMVILMGATWKQVRHWENSERLFEHAIKVTSGNYIAHNHLGVALKNQDRPQEAVAHYLQALKIKPDYTIAHYNLGCVLARQGLLVEAIEHFKAALRLNPDLIEAHNNLGLALERQNRWDEAVKHYSAALRIRPDFANAHYNLANILSRQQRLAEAEQHYLAALRIKPDLVDAYYNLGNVLESQNRPAEAVEHYLKALELKPGFAEAHNNLGLVLEHQGRWEEAVKHYSAALRIRPDFVNAHYNIGNTLSRQGDLTKAVDHYLQALRIKPRHADTHNNLGIVLFRKQDIQGAIHHFKTAISIQPDNVHARNNLQKALERQRQTGKPAANQ